ncbi:MAG: DUF5681 domain-containing protein [Acetobacteraceae bacterium]
MIDDRSYRAGDGRSPRHIRSAEDRSGNSKERPKGRRNLASLLDDVLDERVVVTESGTRRAITKREAIVAELVNMSVAADFKAMTLLLGMIQQIEGRGSGAAPEALVTEADDMVIENFVARLRAAREPADDGSYSS